MAAPVEVPIKLKVDTTELDEAIAKARELRALVEGHPAPKLEEPEAPRECLQSKSGWHDMVALGEPGKIVGKAWCTACGWEEA